jgi:hypothetical protein
MFIWKAVYHVGQGRIITGEIIRFYPNTKSGEEVKSVRGGAD